MKNTIKRLDSIHQQLKSTVTPIGSEQFSKRPDENEWSVAEVVQHLYLVEERVLAELEKKVKEPPVKTSLLKKLVPMRIVAFRFRRVIAPKAVRPADLLPKDTALQKYDEARDRMKRFCLEHGKGRLSQVSFLHPLLGYIDGTAAVRMVAFHEVRHFKQINEIIRKLKLA
jgi:hypothetical protein